LSSNQFDTPLKRFFAIFPANHFWSYYFTATPDEIGRRLLEYLSSVPWWAVILILIGALILLRERLPEGLYPFTAFLVIWGFATTVSFSIYRQFYVPVAVITAVWFGVGASELLSLLEGGRIPNQMGARIVQSLVMILLIVLPVWNARTDLIPALRSGYPLFVRRDHIYPVFAPDKAINDAQKMISHIEDNSIVFAPWDKLYSYVYTAHIEDGKTGISFHEAWSTDEEKLADSAVVYIDQNLDRRPVYFTVNMEDLTQYYRVEKIDDTLYKLYRK